MHFLKGGPYRFFYLKTVLKILKCSHRCAVDLDAPIKLAVNKIMDGCHHVILIQIQMKKHTGSEWFQICAARHLQLLS